RLLVCLVAGLVLLGLAAYRAHQQMRAWREFRAARELLARYRPAEARAHLEVCLQIWPRDPETHLLAAQAARQAGDFEAAANLLREYDELPGRDPEARTLELALGCAASGNLDPVEAHLQTLLAQGDSRSELILEALVAGYLRTHRTIDAMRQVEAWL